MTLLLLTLLGCSSDKDSAEPLAPEPLDLPADPAVQGAPVGVRTETIGGVSVEIWYPAAQAEAGGAGESIDPTVFVPQVVLDVLGPLQLPAMSTYAIRDAQLRPPVEPYPLVLFSHGFGGFRLQSVDVTTHLASRGYIVAAVDHPGRMLGDVLPCLFLPVLEGCDLSGFTDDPGPDDLSDLLDLVSGLADEGWLEGAVDLERIAVGGHSAGANTTTSFGQDQDHIAALFPMAGGAPVERDVPTLFLAGSCDSYPDLGSVTASAAGTAQAELVAISGAGHLAFSDLCELDLARFAADYLEGRDDVNVATYESLLALATDGCPGRVPQESTGCDSFLDLQTSDPIIRHYATVFLDEALRGEGEGVQAGVYAEAELITP